MKKAKDVADLASRLTVAATTPVMSVAPPPPAPVTERAAPPAAAPVAARRRGSVSVFLRLPPELHAGIEAIAIAKTRETGRGVTVQQVILDKLAGAV
jgi:hypothetical protein